MADLKSIIPFIAAWEGGLSRATTDTASKNPAPWPFKGQTGWHTNKGVTYKTFSELAPKLGYANTAENFFLMPMDIWMKIYRVGYWEPMALDQVKSQAVASAMADYAWMSGVGGAQSRIREWLKSNYGVVTKTAADVAAAINKLTQKGEKEFFAAFIEHRKQMLLALNQPANEKGWLNRMKGLYDTGLKLIGNNPGTSIAGAAFFLGFLHLLMLTASPSEILSNENSQTNKKPTSWLTYQSE